MSPASGKQVRIAVIGDRLMLPSMFEEAIRTRCGDGLAIETPEMPWPDEPMERGYTAPRMDGLKGYQGDAEEIVRFVDDADIVVTQLAPFSASMLDRLPNLKLIALSRGGPVNIDMTRPDSATSWSSTPPGVTLPPSPSSRSALLSLRPALLRADTTGCSRAYGGPNSIGRT